MPEMTVTLRWPDGRQDDCYSPSLVMHDHLVEGTTYTVADLVERAARGLDEAGERVRSLRGFACTAAAASRTAIERTAARYRSDESVVVVAMRPPLGGPR